MPTKARPGPYRRTRPWGQQEGAHELGEVDDSDQQRRAGELEHQQAGRYKQAIAAYDRAIKASPGAAEAYNNRGLAYLDSGAIASRCIYSAGDSSGPSLMHCTSGR
jgi:tetratricopeptide (TPR) repeat protein